MRRLRALFLLLPALIFAPGCVVAGGVTPVGGYGYGYAQPYYAPAPSYYAPRPVYRPYAPPPPRYYAPPPPRYVPPVRHYAPPPRHWSPPRHHGGNWGRGPDRGHHGGGRHWR